MRHRDQLGPVFVNEGGATYIFHTDRPKVAIDVNRCIPNLDLKGEWIHERTHLAEPDVQLLRQRFVTPRMMLMVSRQSNGIGSELSGRLVQAHSDKRDNQQGGSKTRQVKSCCPAKYRR
jgi:hypothetical protein